MSPTGRCGDLGIQESGYGYYSPLLTWPCPAFEQEWLRPLCITQSGLPTFSPATPTRVSGVGHTYPDLRGAHPTTVAARRIKDGDEIWIDRSSATGEARPPSRGIHPIAWGLRLVGAHPPPSGASLAMHSWWPGLDLMDKMNSRWRLVRVKIYTAEEGSRTQVGYDHRPQRCMVPPCPWPARPKRHPAALLPRVVEKDFGTIQRRRSYNPDCMHGDDRPAWLPAPGVLQAARRIVP